MPGKLLILGPQRPRHNLGDALRDLGARGPVVTITTGWRHDEGEIEPLHHAIREAGCEPISLPLYAWFEQLSGAEPELASAYKARQAHVRAYKELYRTRLQHGLAAVRSLHERLSRDRDLVAPELGRALAAVRLLDTQVLDHIAEIATQHPAAARPWDNARARERHDAAKELLDRASAVVIAGGHVAVLRNRMRFFGLEVLLPRAIEGGAHLIAWSAGAMALADRVALFYDDPPEGASDAEILDSGLGLLPEVLFFPHARRRLRLDDPERLAVLASRFGPRRCIGLENGAWLEHDDGRWIDRGEADTAFQICTDGQIRAVGELP